jgi:hypothetical protein
VYDFEVDPVSLAETSLNSYDKAASTIATFISLLRKYYEVTGDYSPFNQYQLDVMTGGIGMLSTQDADGLSWAKPEYKVKNLVDNTEIYKGLEDSVWLFRNLYKAEGPAAWFESLQKRVSDGIETKLWNEASGKYIVAISEIGEVTKAQWGNDVEAEAELLPIITGLIESSSERAKSLYKEFNQYQKGWIYSKNKHWDNSVLAAYAGAVMGDKTSVSTFLNSFKEQNAAKDYTKDWNIMHAGVTMLAAQIAKLIP